MQFVTVETWTNTTKEKVCVFYLTLLLSHLYNVRVISFLNTILLAKLMVYCCMAFHLYCSLSTSDIVATVT